MFNIPLLGYPLYIVFRINNKNKVVNTVIVLQIIVIYQIIPIKSNHAIR